MSYSLQSNYLNLFVLMILSCLVACSAESGKDLPKTDTTAPVITKQIPDDRATAVAIFNPITVTFDKVIKDVNENNVALVKYVSTKPVDFDSDVALDNKKVDIVVAVDGNKLTITPYTGNDSNKVNFITQTRYKITLTDIKDTAGNSLAPTSWEFATVNDMSPNSTVLADLAFSYKTLTFSWDEVVGATYYVIQENPDNAAGYTDITPKLTTLSESIILRPEQQNRPNATYIVKACNDAGCIESDALDRLTSFSQTTVQLKSNSVSNSSGFGIATALSRAVNNDLTLVVGSPEVEIYNFKNNTWNFLQTIPNPRLDLTKSAFGSKVAISNDAKTVAITDSSRESSGFIYSGVFYIYNLKSSGYELYQTIEAPVPAVGIGFSSTLKLSGDGETIVLSEWGWTGTNSPNAAPTKSGVVHIYSLDTVNPQAANNWKHTKTIEPPILNASFGGSVAINASGDTVVIGDMEESTTVSGSGAVHVYKQIGVNWGNGTLIKSLTPEIDRRFGQSVAIDSNGLIAVLSTRDAISSATGNLISAVYLYGGSSTTNTWRYFQTLTDSVINISSYDNNSTITFSYDGTYLAVSKPGGELSGVPNFSGFVTLYSTDRTWYELKNIVTTNLVSVNPGTDYGFGSSVSLNDDASVMVIGEPGESVDPNSQGTVHIY